jgi:hypothetical protein
MIWYLRSRAIARLNFRGNTCITAHLTFQFVIRSGNVRNARLGGYDACIWAHELVPSRFVLRNIASAPRHR